MTMQPRVAQVKARYVVFAVDGVACTNTRNTRVLVLDDGQFTCAYVCSYEKTTEVLIPPSRV